MLIDPHQVDLFAGCADGVGAEFVERFLMDSAASCVARFARRGADAGGFPDLWHDQVRAIVAANGGRDELARCHAGLEELIDARLDAVVIRSTEGAVDKDYRALVASLG